MELQSNGWIWIDIGLRVEFDSWPNEADVPISFVGISALSLNVGLMVYPIASNSNT